MKFSIGDHDFEAPFWIYGSAADLRALANELLTRANGSHDYYGLAVGYTEESGDPITGQEQHVER